MNIENLMQIIKEKDFQNITFKNKKKRIFICRIDKEVYNLMINKINPKSEITLHDKFYNSLNELEMDFLKMEENKRNTMKEQKLDKDLNNLFNNKKV